MLIKGTQRILVLGASGYIGQHLSPLLSQQGHQVRAAGRRLEWMQQQNWPNVTCCQVDLHRPETIAPALQDIDVVYYLVHGMADSTKFVDLETAAAQNLRDQLKGSSVKEVIFLGACQPKGQIGGAHLQARQATGDILRASGIPVTELRAAIILGPGSAALEVMRDMVYNLPILTPPRWVRSKSSPIALQNLLTYLSGLLEHPTSEHRLFEVAGPEYISYEEMFRRFIRLSGKKRVMLPIPLPTRFISVYWLNLITSVPTTVAKALIEGLKYDLPSDGSALQALIPQTLLTFEQAVADTLSREEETVATAEWGFDPEARSRWRPGYGFYPKQAGFTLTTMASPEQLWRVIQRVGGKEGYFYANSLWQLRAKMDDLLGGARHYGRPERDTLALQDQIDNWKVLTLKPQRQLTLLFGMKAPGLGRLTFTLNPIDSQQTELDVRAWWHPAGTAGLLYWFAMMPPHLFIFKGMAKRIAQLAEQEPHH